MAFDLFVTSVAPDSDRQTLVYTFLNEEDRPLLEDDVPLKNRELFARLDEVPSYDWGRVLPDNVLDLQWCIRRDDIDEVYRTLEDLHDVGLQNIYAAILMDGFFSGALLVDEKGQIQQLSVDSDVVESLSCDEDTGEGVLAMLKSLRAKHTLKACD